MRVRSAPGRRARLAAAALTAAAVLAVVVAAPAGAATGTSVTLVGSSQWGPDASGTEHIVGVVQNTGTVYATAIQVDLALLDRSGGTLTTVDTFALIDTLAPGERSPFEESFTPPAGYDHFRVAAISPGATSQSPNHHFLTRVTKHYKDGTGWHYAGSVTNDNATTDQNVEVIFTFFNSAGAPVESDFTYVQTDNLSDVAPGQTAVFNENDPNSTDPRYPKIASYSIVTQSTTQPEDGGYWLAASNGSVFGAGAAASYGGIAVGSSDPVVGIAGLPGGSGYWLVTQDGTVANFGSARNFGDLPAMGIHVQNIVAIARTTDGGGYWLIGSDGGEFAFGNAKYHGSLPGLGIHVHDVVGMVASVSGAGYLIVGGDGGVFAFGATHFFGSLPGIGVHVNDIRGIIPAPAGTGYVLVGSDGGAFNFGSGAPFKGSVPGDGFHVSDIVGLALTPDSQGYWMAGANGVVYAFGDADSDPVPAGVSSNLPVAAIASA